MVKQLLCVIAAIYSVAVHTQAPDITMQTVCVQLRQLLESANTVEEYVGYLESFIQNPDIADMQRVQVLICACNQVRSYKTRIFQQQYALHVQGKNALARMQWKANSALCAASYLGLGSILYTGCVLGSYQPQGMYARLLGMLFPIPWSFSAHQKDQHEAVQKSVNHSGAVMQIMISIPLIPYLVHEGVQKIYTQDRYKYLEKRLKLANQISQFLRRRCSQVALTEGM